MTEELEVEPAVHLGPVSNSQLPNDQIEATATARKPPPRQLVIGIVATAIFMGAVDLTIVATALPAIHRNLGASINWTGWTITIYGLSIVVALPIAGKLSVQFGRRRVFLVGIAIFTVASLLCGFATDIYMLIAFRAMQAIGGGTFQPSAAGLVADHFGKDRDRAIGLFGTFNSSGQIVGPIVGGLLVGYLSWRWIFLFNVPIGVMLLLLTLKFIPESTPRVGTAIDVRGLVLTAAFVLAAIFGITSLGNKHTSIDAPIVLVPELCAVILLALFIRHTVRAAEPFIAMRLLRGRGFAAMNSINLIQGAVTLGVASLIPLYAEQRYHLASISAGTLLTARAVGATAVGAVVAFSLRRTGYRLPMFCGFSVVAIGWLLVSVAPRWGISPFVWLTVCVGITGLGLGAVNPPSSNAGLQLAPDQVSTITGLRSMFLILGVVFSVSITTSVLNRSTHPGLTEAHLLWVVAGIIVLVLLPIVRRVPEHKGIW